MKLSELQQAISTIKIPEALERKLIHNCTGKKARPVSYRRVTGLATACMLLIVMLVGIPFLVKNPTTGNMELMMADSPLVIQVAAASDNNEYVVENIAAGTKIVLGRYHLVMSCVPGFPFFFSYPGTYIELTVDNGQLALWDQEPSLVDGHLTTRGTDTGSGKVEAVGNTYTVNGEGRVFWQPFTADVEDLPETAVIEYRVCRDNHVIGYGIIQIDCKDYVYSAKLLLATGFPPVDGKYQNVTAEALQEMKQQVLGQGD